jgi:O-antigen/teichoic acid export membrane protein
LSAEKIILLIYGPDFIPAVLPFRVLCVAQILNSLFGYSGLILNMIGSEVLTLKCLLAGFMLNVVLSAILIPGFGSTGAAIASACGLVLWKGITVIILFKKFNIRCGPLLWCR